MFSFRLYRPTDLDALFGLDLVCFEPPFRFTRAAMKRFAEAKRARVVLAETGAELAGFVLLHFSRPGKEWLAYVVTLDIAPFARRQGLGRALLERGETLAEAAGARAMWLHVSVENAGAIHFYDQLGYAQASTVTSFYGSGRDARLLKKPLRSAKISVSGAIEGVSPAA